MTLIWIWHGNKVTILVIDNSIEILHFQIKWMDKHTQEQFYSWLNFRKGGAVYLETITDKYHWSTWKHREKIVVSPLPNGSSWIKPVNFNYQGIKTAKRYNLPFTNILFYVTCQTQLQEKFQGIFSVNSIIILLNIWKF